MAAALPIVNIGSDKIADIISAGAAAGGAGGNTPSNDNTIMNDAEKLLMEVKSILLPINESLQNILTVLKDIKTVDEAMLTQDQRDSLKKSAYAGTDFGDGPDKVNKADKLELPKGGGIMAFGLLGMTAGFVGFLGAVALELSGLEKYWKAVNLPRILGGIKDKIGAFFGSFDEFGKSIGKLYDATRDGLVWVKNIVTNISEWIGTKLSKILDMTYWEQVGADMSKFFEWLSKPFKAIGEIFTTVGDKFSSVTKFLGEAFDIGMKVFRGIGDVVSAIFAPLKKVLTFLGPVGIAINWFLALFDFFGGFIKGFSEEQGSFWEKIKAGFVEGIEALFRGMITEPLDMLKDMVAWVLKKFGWEDAAQALEDFSFTKLFDDLIAKVKEFAGKLMGDPVEMMKPIIDWVESWDTIDMVKNLALKMLGASDRIKPSTKPTTGGAAKGVAARADAGAGTSALDVVAASEPPKPPNIVPKTETDEARLQREKLKDSADIAKGGGHTTVTQVIAPVQQSHTEHTTQVIPRQHNLAAPSPGSGRPPSR